MGFKTALDDFGNGYANLDLLTDLTPDKLKIDRELVMHCNSDFRRQALLNAIILLAQELDMTLIAEGVETRGEALWLAHAGIVRQQGFYFAKPAINALCTDITPLLMGLKSEVESSSGAVNERD
ncbi:hypothetical protein HORIV_10530 [Vreelandella olivaria]|uniref:EAL domain-containing protein n=1 Tax=Vreelandella olivaria TaxID=390919 RepID=A0ABM7GE02_9GAMM|nr:hypothetical protein HORIV_10530 [Halomonas olivaria]